MSERALPRLGQLLLTLYGAYEYLRDHDLAAVSSTSRRLRAGDVAPLRHRLGEELQELAGVLEGTHRHEGGDADVVLEGYEVLYWLLSAAAASGLSYPDLEARFGHLADSDRPGPAEVARRLRALGQRAATGELLPLVGEVAAAVGAACVESGVDPARLLERDLTEMRGRPYLGAYFRQPA